MGLLHLESEITANSRKKRLLGIIIRGPSCKNVTHHKHVKFMTSYLKEEMKSYPLEVHFFLIHNLQRKTSAKYKDRRVDIHHFL